MEKFTPRISLAMLGFLFLFEVLDSAGGGSFALADSLLSRVLLISKTLIAVIVLLKQDDLSRDPLSGFILSDLLLLPLLLISKGFDGLFSDLILSQAIYCAWVYLNEQGVGRQETHLKAR